MFQSYPHVQVRNQRIGFSVGGQNDCNLSFNAAQQLKTLLALFKNWKFWGASIARLPPTGCGPARVQVKHQNDWNEHEFGLYEGGEWFFNHKQSSGGFNEKRETRFDNDPPFPRTATTEEHKEAHADEGQDYPEADADRSWVHRGFTHGGRGRCCWGRKLC